MRVFVNTDFTGFWPVGTSAVVAAPNKKIAAELLNEELRQIGLVGDATADGMQEFKNLGVVILNDGNY